MDSKFMSAGCRPQTLTVFTALSQKTLLILRKNVLVYLFCFYLLPAALLFLIGIGRFGLQNATLGIGAPAIIPTSINEFVAPGQVLAWTNECGCSLPSGIISTMINDAAGAYSVKEYSSHDALLSACVIPISPDLHASPCFAGVTFWPLAAEHQGLGVNYTISFPSAAFTFAPDAKGTGLLQNGLLSLQLIIETATAKQLAPNVASDVTSSLVYNQPFTSLTKTQFNQNYYGFYYNYIENVGSLAVLFIFFPQTFWFMTAIVKETELRLREILFIAGLSPVIYFCSYLTVAVGIFFPQWLLVATMAWAMLFPASAFSIILVLFVLTGVSLLSLCLLLDSFFTRARLAGAISSVIVFCLGAIGYLTIYAQSTSLVQIFVSLLFSPAGLVIGFCKLTRAEERAVSISPATLLEPSTFESGLTFGALLAAMAANIAVNLVAAWLLTMSQGAGPWWILPSINCSRLVTPITSAMQIVKEGSIEVQAEVDALESDVIYESWSESRESPTVVRLRRLRKQYSGPSADGKPPAIAGLSLDLYQNTVLSLLGQNGSGKTTLMSMLTGLIPASAGCAYFTFEGSSFRLDRDLDHIRRNIGFCPQHDVLWPELSVLEHLKLFASVKGVPSERILAEAKEWIDRVGLDKKGDAAVAELSGGQRRRLSLALAFIGGSKVLFLDEPSAGVDPLSRRAIWEIIQTNMSGRTIVLTTHFLDEAEILGSRVALLNTGRLLALGTSSFLKQHLGLGYRLDCTLSHENSTQDAVSLVRKAVSTESDSTISSVNHGRNISIKLPPEIDTRIPGLLRLLEENGRSVSIESFGVSSASLQDIYVELMTAEKKKADTASVVLDTSITIHGANDEVVEPQQPSARVRPGQSSTFRRIVTLMWKRWLLVVRDLWFAALPLVLSIALAVVVGTIFQDLAFNACPLSLTTIIPATPLTASTTTSPLGDLCFLTTLSPTSAISLPPGLLVENAEGSFTSSIVANSTTLFGGSTTAVPPGSVKWPNLIAASRSDVSFADVAALNLLNNMLLRNATNKNASFPPSMLVAFQPFPQQESVADFIDWTRYFAFLIVTLLGWALVISLASAMPVVNEQSMGAKTAQRAAGVTPFQYWAATGLWDSMHLLVCAAVLASGLCAVQGWVPDFLLTLLVLWVVALAGSGLGYLMSFIISSPAIVLAACSGYLFLLAVGVFVSIIVVGLDPPQNPVISYIIYGGMAVNPLVVLMQAQFSGLNILLLSCGGGSNMWATAQIGLPLAIISGQALLSALLVLGLEALRDWRIARAAARAAIAWDSRNMKSVDDDVAAEAYAANKYVSAPAKPSDDDAAGVVVAGLRKTFGLNVAVENLSLLLPQREVFVIVGANGSGKTTALRILCAQEAPTAGDVILSGHALRTDLPAICRVIGVCPQFDVLYGALTPREHLTLFAALRGLHGADILAEVEWLLVAVDLGGLADRPAGALSGGNRRKLSMALACVGTPPVLVLDEPSTGMDALTMRSMWQLIRKLGERQTILLTTHSMEEAEAVASRVGVMASGRLLAIGSVQHLKSRFGAMYQLDVEGTSATTAASLSQSVAAAFPGSELLQQHGAHVSVKVPAAQDLGCGKRKVLAELFDFASHLREKGDALNFRISQTTLERIFVELSTENANNSFDE